MQLPDPETKYYSSEINKWLTFGEMIEYIPVEELPKNEEDLKTLFFCFGIENN